MSALSGVTASGYLQYGGKECMCDLRTDILGDYLSFRAYTPLADTYIYYLASGEISVENGIFTITDCDYFAYEISENGSVSEFLSGSVDTFTVDNTAENLVYSSLSGYPKLESWGDRIDYAKTFFLLCAGCYFLVCGILSYCKRG